MAHALASSFNFQGRVKKTFYVLTDDKVGAGPRLRPQSLNKDSEKSSGSTSKEINDAAQPMETDSHDSSVPPQSVNSAAGNSAAGNSVAGAGGLTLSAKLAAKRKATDNVTDSVAKARR